MSVKLKKFSKNRFDSIMPLLNRICNDAELPFSVDFDKEGTATYVRQKIWDYFRLKINEQKDVLTEDEMREMRMNTPTISQMGKTLIVGTARRRGSTINYTIHTQDMKEITVIGGMEVSTVGVKQKQVAK